MSCSNYCSFFSIFLTFLLILKTIYDFIADEFWKLLNTVHIIVFMFLCICIRVFVHVYSATHLKAPHFSAILSYPLFCMLSYRYYLILSCPIQSCNLFIQEKQMQKNNNDSDKAFYIHKPKIFQTRFM